MSDTPPPSDSSGPRLSSGGGELGSCPICGRQTTQLGFPWCNECEISGRCVCGDIAAEGIVHRPDAPCYLIDRHARPQPLPPPPPGLSTEGERVIAWWDHVTEYIHDNWPVGHEQRREHGTVGYDRSLRGVGPQRPYIRLLRGARAVMAQLRRRAVFAHSGWSDVGRAGADRDGDRGETS